LDGDWPGVHDRPIWPEVLPQPRRDPPPGELWVIAHPPAQAERRLIAGEAWRDHGLVFDYGDGRPWAPDRFSQVWAEHAERSGFGRVRLHDLRHGMATLALAAGIHPRTVADRLGHSTTGLVLDLYSHVLPSLESEAAARLDAVLVAGS
jgi:integrase